MCTGSDLGKPTGPNRGYSNPMALKDAGSAIQQSLGNFQSPLWGRPFSYAPSAGTPQAHQFFDGTGPVFGGGQPPGGTPPTPPGPPNGNANPPGPPPNWPNPTNTGPRPGNNGQPPIIPPPLPGGYTPTPGGANVPGGGPVGTPTNTGPRPGGGGINSVPPAGPYPGGPTPPTPTTTPPPAPPSTPLPRPGLDTNNKMGMQKDAPAAPASNPLLAALYSGHGGDFTPQDLNRYGAQSSNKWDPAAVSIAGSQAGFNTPAPMFQAGHLANGNATMQNGVFTWTPQGLAAMQANSGMKK